MITVSTAELKTHMGRYLRMVRNGETIKVTSHRHAVARLVPCSDESYPDVVQPTRPIADLGDVTAVELGTPVDGVGALLSDRARR
ncbi:type II toxin-antitoxin system Phd/YefM family antitoxin [Candidatus Latescibacterota bacterium]